MQSERHGHAEEARHIKAHSGTKCSNDGPLGTVDKYVVSQL